MIVLDTSVISELLRQRPEKRVMDWLAAQPRTSLFTTAVTRCEVLLGVRLMPQGKRRKAHAAATQAIFDEDFAGRVLPFGDEDADLYAQIGAARRLAGKPISQFDAMIAAIACANGATLATRNVTDFDLCGIDVIDPWRA